MNTNKCDIYIQSENRAISAEPGQTLLEALVGAGVLLRADCGGRGRCGKCKIRIIEPGNFENQDELPESGVLTQAEIEDGFRLVSQPWPQARAYFPSEGGSFLNGHGNAILLQGALGRFQNAVRAAGVIGAGHFHRDLILLCDGTNSVIVGCQDNRSHLRTLSGLLKYVPYHGAIGNLCQGFAGKSQRLEASRDDTVTFRELGHNRILSD